jgi:hypothetical protein
MPIAYISNGIGFVLSDEGKANLKDLWKGSTTEGYTSLTKIYKVKPNYPVISSFTQGNSLFLKILIASPANVGYDQILHCEIKFDDEGNCISTGLEGTYYKLYSEV